MLEASDFDQVSITETQTNNETGKSKYQCRIQKNFSWYDKVNVYVIADSKQEALDKASKVLKAAAQAYTEL